MHPHIPGCGPQAVEGLQKRPAVLPFVRGHRVVEVAARRPGADLGQTVRREAEHRRAQHRDQGHILPGIVDDLQQPQHDGDLHGLEKVLLGFKGTGDVLLREGLGKGGRAAARRAQQDHDVLRAAGAQRAVSAGDRIALVQQGPDPLCHEPGLCGELLHRAVFFPGTLPGADEMELRVAVLPGRIVGCAEMQRLVLPVLHIAHVRREDIGKDEVGRVQDLPPGAEILGEQDLALLPGACLFIGKEPGILLQKDGGVCQPEAVNALLYIAHRENILPIPGHCPENGVLYLIGVLVFIHQDLLVPLGYLPPKLCGGAVLPHQQPQGQMLLVGEVCRVEPELFRLVSPGELAGQAQQGLHGGRHGPHGLLPAHIQQLCDLLELGLAGLPHRLECDDLRLVLAAFGGSQAGKRNGIRRPAGLLPAAALRQSVECLRTGAEFFSVAPLQGLVSCRVGSAASQQGRPMGCLAVNVCQQHSGIGSIVKAAAKGRPGCLVLFQPLLRVGVALELFVDLQHQ